MFSPFDLPTSLLVLLWTTQTAAAATRTFQKPWKRDNLTLATTGSGPQYASACSSASSAYDSSSTSWKSAHQWVVNETQVIGGRMWSSAVA